MFDNIQTDWSYFYFLVKLRLGYWARVWNPDCPYNPGDFVHKLEGVKRWRNEKQLRGNIEWCPPPA